MNSGWKAQVLKKLHSLVIVYSVYIHIHASLLEYRTAHLSIKGVYIYNPQTVLKFQNCYNSNKLATKSLWKTVGGRVTK